jgi:signal transduction histidine kinase
MQDVIRVILIALLYFMAHWIAFLFPDTERILAAIWPAGGIGLAALLLNRRRLWIPILAGMFIAGNIANLMVNRPLFNSLGFMTANVLESLLCAWAIIYWCGENVTFTRVREVLALIFAAVFVNAGTALIGAGTAWFTSLAPFWNFWETWWVADGLGILIVAPLIVAWLKPREPFLPPQWGRLLESGFFLALWSAVAWLAFQGGDAHGPLTPQPYILVVMLAYVSLRFSMRGTTSAIAIMSVILISSRSVNAGSLIWSGDSLRDRVLMAQMFIASITIAGYLLNSTFTERKQAENEIRQLNASLEQRVEERTRELTEAQEKLVQHEKLAVLGQLAGGVGHELRNPLGVISNAVYFLKISQPDASAKVKEYLDLIEKHIRISDKIVTDLLDFTRVKLAEREAVSIPEAIQQTLKRFPAPENVQVTLDLPADLPQAYADPQQVIQILSNLTLNACQAMEARGGKLTISARKHASREAVCVSVQDTGAGISAETMKKLFEPLFTTRVKGIGLGLVVSRRLAEANGGVIEAQSEAGAGSTFTVYIPIYEAAPVSIRDKDKI